MQSFKKGMQYNHSILYLPFFACTIQNGNCMLDKVAKHYSIIPSSVYTDISGDCIVDEIVVYFLSFSVIS